MLTIKYLLGSFSIAILAIFLSSALAADKDGKDPNRFFRLTKPLSERNPPLAKDGIHDPDAEGLKTLQAPKSAFEKLAHGNSGNYVDWMKAWDKGEISPRYSYEKPDQQPMPMQLNIIRQVKGSTPNVLFPHKAHTLWLDCSNCHPDVFVPKKGANSMSMAEIILGKGCGMCHGKVAFPISECRRCHSESKGKSSEPEKNKDVKASVKK